MFFVDHEFCCAMARSPPCNSFLAEKRLWIDNAPAVLEKNGGSCLSQLSGGLDCLCVTSLDLRYSMCVWVRMEGMYADMDGMFHLKGVH